MSFVDDLAMIEGTDDSYKNPETLEEAWEHRNELERELWTEALRKEFNVMTRRKVWREIHRRLTQTM